MGRFAETALEVVLTLRGGPRDVDALLDAVRAVRAHTGPGTLYGALARLELRSIIGPDVGSGGRRAYRLSESRVGPTSERSVGGLS